MSFAEFGLSAELARAVADLGFETPMPIQKRAIPEIMAGRDVLGKSQTGTGKTAAFGLPILHRFLATPSQRIRLLVVAPTRELAIQVHEHLTALAAHTNLSGFTVTGGARSNEEEHRFRTGADWICATPGRLLDHLGKDYVDFQALEVLVLDEADRLFEMGFLPDVRRIVSYLPERRQTLMFSATLPPEMQELARKVLNNPVRIDIGETTSADKVREEVWPVAHHQKFDLLVELMKRREMECVLLFTRTKARAEKVADRLRRADFATAMMHGDRPMEERRRALNEFRAGNVRVLVATDLAARGLDIDGISHVVNFDVPEAPEDYIHRVGRTGRADAQGDALTFCSPSELTDLVKIEHMTRKSLPEHRLDGFDYEEEIPQQAPRKKSRSRQAGDFSTREPGKGPKESPFTKSGKVRRGFEVPDPEKDRRKKKKKRRIKKRLPHER
ncbi:DEAD/DEAH box helicase [bacterium]|nr:DEAD/DEAH box helicase [bacterium]